MSHGGFSLVFPRFWEKCSPPPQGGLSAPGFWVDGWVGWGAWLLVPSGVASLLRTTAQGPSFIAGVFTSMGNVGGRLSSVDPPRLDIWMGEPKSQRGQFNPPPPLPVQGCSRREGTSEAAPDAGRQAVGGGCRSGWGRLLSVTNAVEPGFCREGDSGIGWAPWRWGGDTSLPMLPPSPRVTKQWPGERASLGGHASVARADKSNGPVTREAGHVPRERVRDEPRGGGCALRSVPLPLRAQALWGRSTAAARSDAPCRPSRWAARRRRSPTSS